VGAQFGGGEYLLGRCVAKVLEERYDDDVMSAELKSTAYRFLRWSERYTRTDMVYLAHGGFWLMLKTVLAMLIAFCLSFAFANLLPQATYGEYKYIFSIFSLLAITTLLGMNSSVARSVARGFEGTPYAALKTKIRWGYIGSVGALCIALYYYLQGNIRLAESFVIVAAFLPFVDTLGIFNALLTGKRLFKVSTLLEVGIQAISASVIATALYMSDNLLIVLACYFGTYALLRLCAFFFVMRRYAENDAVDPTAMRYGKHLSAMEILATAADTIETMLIWQFVGPASVAIYSFAKAIPFQITIALKRLPTLALPKFARRDFLAIRTTITRRLFQVFGVVALIVCAYILSAPYIYATFFPQYLDSIWYSQLFALTLLTFPKSIIGTIFNAHGDTKALYINSTATPIINILLLLMLVPHFGILGAVISEIVTQTFSLLLMGILLYFYRFTAPSELR